jgi:hypothetical protein
MKRLLRIAAALILSATPLFAQSSPVVVELFTSQGCSSCPPADDIMEHLSQREDVIPLSLHVDYWDYIGWKDEFAVPQNAERQRAYAAAAGRRSVYTPEMVVNGVTDIVGAKPMELSEAISSQKLIPSPVVLELARSGEQVTIKAQTVGAVPGRMVLQMLRYRPLREARITRGENAGKTLTYVNVAEDWQTLRAWDGASALEISAEAPGDRPVVVLVQGAEAGPILAAARLR